VSYLFVAEAAEVKSGAVSSILQYTFIVQAALEAVFILNTQCLKSHTKNALSSVPVSFLASKTS